MIRVLSYFNDCRDRCSFYREHHACSMACYPFNVGPIQKGFLHRLRHAIENKPKLSFPGEYHRGVKST